ncbi:peptidoglycan-binding domain-containing protein [Roseicitreum antarcticum]|uniref:Putative peptidoglycan binding domain-containing protein n=1 Tax=Roseicitreum antarcticum TaxID=564137 RepID=A0A1H2SFP5_9RHOB|nr:peptidoglycan-binding domain-containing protein [Roseicitreum antarcticum]SDW30430.1 Putative peptidoglycan binding domain-containing protein [Roseicitreum antarcticum]
MTMRYIPRATWLSVPLLALALSACQNVDANGPQASRADTATAPIDMTRTADGACWAGDVFAHPMTGPDGAPGPMEVQIFETPCPEMLTPEVVETLQRALQVRGYHAGPVSGQMDATTRAAVHAFQRSAGIDTAVLSADTARDLGLMPHRPEPL